MSQKKSAEVIIVGGGLAGLSAAIYLGRAMRDTLLIDSGKSMARWEPQVQNYLGFPHGIDGTDLLSRGKEQAMRYHTRFARDTIQSARKRNNRFSLRGQKGLYTCRRLLLATGIYHVPPDIPGVNPCLGHSMFFCKDCDGYRVQAKTVAIYGWNNEAVRYALSMMLYSPCVIIVTDGRKPQWDEQHQEWAREYQIPLYCSRIRRVIHAGRQIQAFDLADGTRVLLEALFTTRGDVVFNRLAKGLGASLDDTGEIVVDGESRTSVHGLYAAGCVTPANCQMIIAAGQGAVAAQAINSDLLEESLSSHELRRFRGRQLRTRKTKPSRLSLRRRGRFVKKTASLPGERGGRRNRGGLRGTKLSENLIPPA